MKALNINVIALYLGNSSRWIISDLAGTNIGLTIILIPLFFSKQQIQHLLADTNVDIVMVCKHKNEQVSSFLCASIEDSNAIESSYLRLKQTAIKAKTKSISKITYTPGSTGDPKGVCLSGNTIETVVISLAEQLARAGIKRHLCLLPFATLLENIAGIYLPLFRGNALITGDSSSFGLKSNHQFCVDRFIRTAKNWQVNSVILLLQMLKAIAEKNQPEQLSSLTFMAVGGGKVSSELIKQCHQQRLPIYEGYGLSECASVVSMNTPMAHKVVQMNNELKVHMDTPESVAKQFVNFITSDSYCIFLGWPEKLLVKLNQIFPNIVGSAIIKTLPTIKKYAQS